MKGWLFLKNCFAVALFKVQPNRFAPDVKTILEKNFPPSAPFRFVQVGANDGISNDFLFDFVSKRKAAGLVIEPLPDYFEKLKQAYRHQPAVRTENLAVHETKKEVVLYKVRTEALNHLPAWAGGIASLNARHYQKAGIAEEHMTAETVPAEHLMTILQAHEISGSLDLLQIDVEGYDFNVLRQVDFGTIKPRIIRYEYCNMPEEETVASIRFLKSKGYHCFYDAMDVIAVQLNSISL